jgi:uncharacterized membrane protein
MKELLLSQIGLIFIKVGLHPSLSWGWVLIPVYVMIAMVLWAFITSAYSHYVDQMEERKAGRK